MYNQTFQALQLRFIMLTFWNTLLSFNGMDCLKICSVFNLKDQIFWLFKMKTKMPSFWKNYTVLVILYKWFGWTFCLLQTVSLGKNRTACKNLVWVLVIFQKPFSITIFQNTLVFWDFVHWFLPVYAVVKLVRLSAMVTNILNTQYACMHVNAFSSFLKIHYRLSSALTT